MKKLSIILCVLIVTAMTVPLARAAKDTPGPTNVKLGFMERIGAKIRNLFVNKKLGDLKAPVDIPREDPNIPADGRKVGPVQISSVGQERGCTHPQFVSGPDGTDLGILYSCKKEVSVDLPNGSRQVEFLVPVYTDLATKRTVELDKKDIPFSIAYWAKAKELNRRDAEYMLARAESALNNVDQLAMDSCVGQDGFVYFAYSVHVSPYTKSLDGGTELYPQLGSYIEVVRIDVKNLKTLTQDVVEYYRTVKSWGWLGSDFYYDTGQYTSEDFFGFADSTFSTDVGLWDSGDVKFVTLPNQNRCSGILARGSGGRYPDDSDVKSLSGGLLLADLSKAATEVENGLLPEPLYELVKDRKYIIADEIPRTAQSLKAWAKSGHNHYAASIVASSFSESGMYAYEGGVWSYYVISNKRTTDISRRDRIMVGVRGEDGKYVEMQIEGWPAQGDYWHNMSLSRNGGNLVFMDFKEGQGRYLRRYSMPTFNVEKGYMTEIPLGNGNVPVWDVVQNFDGSVIAYIQGDNVMAYKVGRENVSFWGPKVQVAVTDALTKSFEMFQNINAPLPVDLRISPMRWSDSPYEMKGWIALSHDGNAIAWQNQGKIYWTSIAWPTPGQ